MRSDDRLPVSPIVRLLLSLGLMLSLSLLIATPLAWLHMRAPKREPGFVGRVLREAERGGIASLGEPITCDACGNADGKMLMRLLAAYAGRNIVLPKGELPDPEPCIDFVEVPCVVALDLMALQQRCLLIRDGSVWRLQPLEAQPDRASVERAIRELKKLAPMSPRAQSLYAALSFVLDGYDGKGMKITGNRIFRILKHTD